MDIIQPTRRGLLQLMAGFPAGAVASAASAEDFNDEVQVDKALAALRSELNDFQT